MQTENSHVICSEAFRLEFTNSRTDSDQSKRITAEKTLYFKSEI